MKSLPYPFLATLFIGGTLLIGGTLPAQAAALTLARGGQPAATIVTPANAEAPIKQAAADLQKYVEKICGVRLPLQEDGKAVPGTGLYVGQCASTQPGDLPAANLNPEAYAIHERGGNLYLTGRYPTPAAFAVYSFLEDQLGVRWFAPGDDWEFVPTGQRGELKVDVQDKVSVPDTSPRIWSGHMWTDSWKDWNLRNKTVLSEVVPRREFQNFVYKILPPSKYAATHPEYYPLVNGKRWIPPSDDDRYWRPCESNPEVQKIFVDYIRQYFKDHPNVDSFSLGMDDIVYMCGCNACRALDAKPTDYAERQFSDRHYKFVEAIAREVKKTNPDKYIGTLVYSIARKPPATVGKLDDNVFGFLTEESAQWYQPEIKKADQALTREWRKRLTHLSRYDYFGMGTFTPRVYPHIMAEQLKFDKSLGLEGMYTEVYTFLPHTAPMIWAFAKLQWDSKPNVDKLLNEFYTKMYGRSAGTMKQYYDVLEKSWNQPRSGRNRWVHRNLQAQATSISADAVKQGMQLLDKALNEAHDEKVARRIGVVRAGLQYAGYAILPYPLSQDLIRNPITNEKEATAALAKIQEIGRLARERQAFWPAAMQRQDLLGENLRGLASLTSLGPNGYLQLEKIGLVENGAAAGALKVLNFYSSREPGKMPELAEKLRGVLPAGEVQDMVKARVWMEQNKPASLLTNGDFESTAPNKTTAKADWSVEGAPNGWSTWSSTGLGKFSLVAGAGRNGSRAVRVDNGGENSVIIQEFKVEPGQKYMITLWARAASAIDALSGNLSIRYRTPAGAWAENRETEKQVYLSETTEWQPVTLLVTIPQNVGTIVLLPGVSGSAGERSIGVYFDDIALYRIPNDL